MPENHARTSFIHTVTQHHTPSPSNLDDMVMEEPELSSPSFGLELVHSIPGYDIVKKLGGGGMGVVYLAQQKNLNRLVALKVMLAEHASTLDSARFAVEAQASARVKHPNIAQVFDYNAGENGGRPYIAMEFCSGGSLADFLNRQPQPPTRAAAIAEALARAVQSAHDAKIIHRDLKPMNVLLALPVVSDGESERGMATTVHKGTEQTKRLFATELLKITDFGLAKKLDSIDGMTQTQAVMGTPRYMAPEQASGNTKKAGPATDIWALGVILYEMLTGSPPFVGLNSFEVISHVVKSDPVAPSARVKVPQDLETICLKCLRKEPEDRYASADKLADDLQAFREGRSISARPMSAAEKGARWVKRNPGVSALLAVVFALLVVFAVGGTAAAFRINQARQVADGNAAEAKAALAKEAEAREDAQLNAAEAKAARSREAEALLEARRKVVRLDLANGSGFADVGKTDSAILWYARGWRDDPEKTPNDPGHRLRVGLFLMQKPELVGLAAHNSPVEDTRTDDKASRVLTRTKSGDAALWEIRAGRLVAKLEHPGGVTAIALSRDGKLALTGGADGVVRVWDADDGKNTLTVTHGSPVSCIDWKPDSAVFATAGGAAGVKLWDAASGNPTDKFPEDPGAYHVVFSADGGRIATANHGGLARVWETEAGRPICEPIPHRARDDYDRLWNVRGGPVISPDGTKLLTSTGPYGDYTLSCWDLKTGKSLWTTGYGVYSQSYSPDAKRLLTTQFRAYLFDPENGKSLSSMITPRECQKAVLLANGKIAAISTGGLLQVWDSSLNPARVTEKTAQAADSFRTLTALADGRHVLAGSADGTVRLYDFGPRSASVPFLESGRANRVRIARGNRVVAYSPDGRLECEYGGVDPPRIGPRDAATLPITLDVPGASAVFSRDGKVVLTSKESSIQAWDASHGKPVGPTIPFASGSTVAYSADGRRAVLGLRRRREIRVIDLVTGKELLAQTYPETEEITSNHPVLNSDGRWLATGDFAFAGSVEVWDVDAGKRVSRFSAHRGNLNDLDITSDGSRLLVCSSDTTARLWDSITGTPLGPVLRHSRFCEKGELSRDGRRAVTMDTDGFVYLWDAVSGDRVGQWGGGLTTSSRTMGVWLTDDGQNLFYLADGIVRGVSLRPLNAPMELVPPFLELVTGQRIDPVTEMVEYLPSDTFLKSPQRYLEAWRSIHKDLIPGLKKDQQ